MILLDEIYINEGYRIIIFFGLFLLGISLISICGKEGGGRRPRRKQLQKQNDDIGAGGGGIKKKIKEEDPFGSERSCKKKRKKSKNRKQKSPPSKKNHEKVVKKPQKEEELNENVETGIQESDNNNNNNVAPASVDPRNEQPLGPVGEEEDDAGIETKQPHFGSDKENQQKSNPVQVSESEEQKQAEKLRSLKEQETPLHTDDFEWLKDKTAPKNGITLKNNIHPVAADAVAPPPSASAHPAQSNLRPPPDTAPEAGAVAGEEEEEESNEENDKNSTKKMNKKKKKKHSSKKKKKKKEKTSKKKKASKKHEKIEKEKNVKKNVEPEIIYPYSLTSPSTKNEKLKDTNEKGLTTIINDELMTKENVEEQQQQEQFVEAKTQQMTVKTDFNQSELPQKNIDKTQKKTTATTTKFLTGIEEEMNNNNNGASKTIYNLAVNGAHGNEIKHPLKELTAKEENGQSKLSETPQAIILQPSGNQNGASKTIYNPTVNGGSAAPVGQMKLPLLTKELTAKSVWNSFLPPPTANIPNEEGQQQQQKLEAASKTIYNPATNGGSLAPASKMKLPILTKESAAKSDWNSVLAASSIYSANNEQQAAAADGKENGKKMS